MSATPFVSFLGPSNLSSYDRTLPPSQQTAGDIPKPFLDAMTVRENVFVEEQKVPLANEFDDDDPRSCHWVIYASINSETEPEQRNEHGDIVVRKKSITRSEAVGTIRLVPFPHEPHPEPGSSYYFNALTTGPSMPPAYAVDRATSLHDGREPYLKLGRLAVIKEFRGIGLAKLLIRSAFTWAQQNPTYFNPSVRAEGMENLGISDVSEIPKWSGLICAHAQVTAIKTWARFGFQEDEEMGKWQEENVEHVGMFARLTL